MAGPEDRETTITFTDADETMQVVTANRKLKGRLKKLGFEPEDTEDGHDFFEVPKEFLQLRKPREFDLSEEDKEERRERLREVRKAAGIGEFSKKGKKGKAAASKKGKAKAAPEPEEDDEDDEVDEDINEMSIGQLRAYAKSQGVSGQGTKKDIIARLEEADEDEEEEDEDEIDDEEEETEVVKPRGRKPSGRKPAGRKR